MRWGTPRKTLLTGGLTLRTPLRRWTGARIAAAIVLACVLGAAVAYRADPDAAAWVAEHLGSLGAGDLSGAHRGSCLAEGGGPDARMVVVPCASGAAKWIVLARLAVAPDAVNLVDLCLGVAGWSQTSGDPALVSGQMGLCLAPVGQSATLRARPADPVAGLHIGEGALIVSLAQAGPQSPMRALATSDNPAYPVWGPDDQLAIINPDGTISGFSYSKQHRGDHLEQARPHPGGRQRGLALVLGV